MNQMETPKTLFEELFTYNFHSNQQLAEVLDTNHEKIDPKSWSLFSHVLNAHEIWNCRILGLHPTHPVWGDRPLGKLAAIDRKNYEQTVSLLKDCDLTDAVSYKTSTGQAFTNSIGEILFHIINHSTYHRGQIALLFRQHDMDPLVSDYIFFKR
jgi:Uncharacterized protein conserved in bacteria